MFSDIFFTLFHDFLGGVTEKRVSLRPQILGGKIDPPPGGRHENKVRGVRVRGPGSGLFSQGVGWG